MTMNFSLATSSFLRIMPILSVNRIACMWPFWTLGYMIYNKCFEQPAFYSLVMRLHLLPQWALLSLAFLASTSSGVIVHRAIDILKEHYDFIVVGGGTAGLVVANRLSENPVYLVLVIEAGGPSENVFNSHVPFFNGRLFKTSADWNYTTEPMPGLGGRNMDYPEGHILGGTSCINGQAYTRGSSDDYDRYAKITGDLGWSWDNLQQYFRKNERWTTPADLHNTTGEFNPSVHGYDGINYVSLAGYVTSFDYRVMKATTELPDEFPFNLDMNSGYQLGIGWAPFTIGGGERSSSARTYLAPQFLARPNLHVLVNSRVSRVLQTGSHDGVPSFRGVELTQGTNAKSIHVTAKKEVILSSGVVGTPNILLHSGIGDPKLLSSVGVKPLIDLPDVGQNLTDHPFVPNTWLVNSTETFETALRNATLAAEQLKQWNETRTGPYAGPTFNIAGWTRMPNNASIFQNFTDPSAGPNTGHFEFIIANGKTRLPIPPTGNFMVIGSVLVTPHSRGNVTIKTNNPFDLPSINPNFLDSDFDIFALREAVRTIRRFAKAPVWSDYILSLVDTATTNQELDQFIRSTAITVSHGVGTSAMSPKGADYGVTDPDLRVKKVSDLRVVDASVLPLIPAGHTQAPTYAVAERAADLIKAAWQ